ncbi:MAG: matrixin family metalloprotease [Nanoarchaeota archaeon]
MGWGDLILVIVLLGALLFGLQFFYNEYYNVDSLTESFVADNPETLSGLTEQSKQFYPGMRFSEKEIGYNFADECDDLKKENVRKAFSILDARTIVSFSENADIEGISILCSKIAPKAEDKGHFVAGEGGPTKILNASVFYIIKEAQIELYRDEKCETPNIALHEILHALGFDHNSNEKSILYPITSCEQEIDDALINSINALYKIESLPDLAITKVDLNKTGRYLNFEIVLSNQGLQNYGESKLFVHGGGEQIGEFKIDEIEVGHSKIFSVTNLKISNDANIVSFEVESSVSRNEMNMNNNKVSINIQSQRE